MNSLLAWSRHLWLWLLPLIFCGVNLIGLTVYRSGFAGRVDSLQDDLERARENQSSLMADKQRSEAFLERATMRREQVDLLYTDHFATESERFTRVMTDVKGLARQAGLNPQSFIYPESPLLFGLQRRDINFNVVGNYDQLRTLINLLELSDHFLILDNIGLEESGGDGAHQLSVSLSVGTVFVEDAADSGRSTS